MSIEMESNNIVLQPSSKYNKKWAVSINNKVIHFGSKGNFDYTLHNIKDADNRKSLYI